MFTANIHIYCAPPARRVAMQPQQSTHSNNAAAGSASAQHERQIVVALSVAHVQPAVRRRPKHVIEKESRVPAAAMRVAKGIGGEICKGKWSVDGEGGGGRVQQRPQRDRVAGVIAHGGPAAAGGVEVERVEEVFVFVKG